MAQISNRQKTITKTYLDRGYCDRDIAEMVGVKKSFVRDYRYKKYNMPPGTIHICDTIIEMLESGKTDSEIAIELSIGIAHINKIRASHNVMTPEKAGKLEILKRMVADGESNKAIAKEIKVSPNTVALWKVEYMGIERAKFPGEYHKEGGPVKFEFNGREGLLDIFYTNLCEAQCAEFRKDVKRGKYKTMEEAIKHAKSPIMEFWSMGNSDSLVAMIKEEWK